MAGAEIEQGEQEVVLARELDDKIVSRGTKIYFVRRGTAGWMITAIALAVIAVVAGACFAMLLATDDVGLLAFFGAVVLTCFAISAWSWRRWRFARSVLDEKHPNTLIVDTVAGTLARPSDGFQAPLGEVVLKVHIMGAAALVTMSYFARLTLYRNGVPIREVLQTGDEDTTRSVCAAAERAGIRCEGRERAGLRLF
jgi:hypothetical protein